MIEKQELHCHNCNRYVQFEIDTELEGNHVLNCPNCGHEHCRVIKDGTITSDRWDRRNNTFTVSGYTITTSVTSTWTNYINSNNNTYSTYVYNYSNSSINQTNSSKAFIYNSWINTTTSLK